MVLISITLSKLGGYFGILRAVRPALLLFGFCVAYAFLNPRKLVPANLKGSLTVRLLIAIGAVVAGSAVFGISQGHAGLFIIESFWKTLAITYLMIVTIRDVSDVRRLCWAFGLGGIVLAYLSIFVVGISKVAIGGTYDANDVGVFMVMTLPLALMLLQTATRRLERIVAMVGIVLLAVTIVKTQSRGAFIGAIVVGMALLLVPGLSVGRRLFYVVAASVTMALAAPPGYWKAMQNILEDPKADYNWDSLNGRRNLAKRGIGYMLKYPVFGIGIDNFRIAEGTISDKALNTLPNHGVRWASPHNSFVQAGAEAGVLGLLLWVALTLANVIIPLRLRYRMPKTWRTGTADERFLIAASVYLPIAQLGFAATAFFVSFAWMEPLYLLSAIVAGLNLVTLREMGALTPTRRVPGFRSARARQPNSGSPASAATSTPS
jgi:O-antigen ligase/polysaccharide polymerase Wzy-like membrane protein